MTSTDQARSGASTDEVLVDWLRHYGIVLLLVTALGAAGAGASWWFATPRYEMWTLAADTRTSLPARQIGVVAQTLFQDQHTYNDALYRPLPSLQPLASLDPPVTLDELSEVVQLRSVPDSPLMIVVARGDNAARTAAISESMAQALSGAFERSTDAPLSILGSPQPAPVETSGSLSLFALLGGIAAFLMALGISIVHYRTRRPVLRFGAMVALISPVTVVAESARRRWLGALRHIAPVGLPRMAREDAAQRLLATGGVRSMYWPGASSRRLARMVKLIGVDLDPEATTIVIVAEPCSRARNLTETASINPVGTTTVLWLT